MFQKPPPPKNISFTEKGPDVGEKKQQPNSEPQWRLATDNGLNNSS